jgi:hypothetical protein
MRTFKTLAIVSALGLLGSLPLVAQLPGDSTQNQPAAGQSQPVTQQPAVQQQDGQQAADQTGDVQGDEGPALQSQSEQAQSAVPQQSDSATVDGDQPGSMTEESELPRTASPLALIALIGSLGIASAFGVRHLHRAK